ncbi:hypothetical protein ACP4OV_026884 [Aristida adscensionis]
MEGMVGWEEWLWEEQIEAMPVLQEFVLRTCEILTHLPPGLAFHARALKILILHHAHSLLSVENFPSLVELDVSCCHELTGITNLPNLHKLSINGCPVLEVLTGVPELRRLFLGDHNMSRLPRYLCHLNLAHLTLCCDLPVLCSMALGNNTPEWIMFQNIQRVEAYDHDGKYRVSYTKHPRYLETNISDLLLSIPRCGCQRLHLYNKRGS